ncbi:hypothetical protein Pan258_49350 [Symmachiella dynata]|uniref:hypothetical protein n=1 Tax=Symmachiella dynata TaxID=2527995 RepID=UPI0011893814|nr:hypothetical protein [Symmachiella dynata]QDT50853.1 hypothetical protein Pan258_49350 [Symmachiella dynata]
MSASKVQTSIVGRILFSVVAHMLRLRAVLRHFSPWVLVVPAIAIASTMGSLYGYFWPAGQPSLLLPFTTALAATSFMTAATCWVLRGDLFHRWLIYLTGCFWYRSVDMSAGKLGTALVLTILICYALAKFDDLRPYLQNRLVVSLLVASLLCQCLPMLMTSEVWSWGVRVGLWPYRVNSAMMLSGRLMLLMTIVASEVLSRTGRLSIERSHSATAADVSPFHPPQSVAGPARPSARKAA